MMMVMFCNALLYMVLTLRLIYTTKTKHKVLFVSLFLTILTISRNCDFYLYCDNYLKLFICQIWDFLSQCGDYFSLLKI